MLVLRRSEHARPKPELLNNNIANGEFMDRATGVHLVVT